MKATKESEPPLPTEQGAEAYLRGANDGKFRQSERERLRWVFKGLPEEPKAEEEKESGP